MNISCFCYIIIFIIIIGKSYYVDILLFEAFKCVMCATYFFKSQ